jgi:hypothetical protein
VDVVFEVASQQYPLDEQAATLMAESLRVKAAHEPGAEGTVGARAVADAIELRLIEDTADPISLGGDGAEPFTRSMFRLAAVTNCGRSTTPSNGCTASGFARRARTARPSRSRSSASAARSVSDSTTETA